MKLYLCEALVIIKITFYSRVNRIVIVSVTIVFSTEAFKADHPWQAKNCVIVTVFPIIRRHIAATQQAVAARTTARSFLVRFIEDRRRKKSTR